METVKLKGRLEIAHDEMNSHIRWRHEVQADRNYYKAEAERLRAALIRMMDAPYHPKVGECEAARKQAREALAAPAAETAQATETGAREEYDVDSRTVSVYPAEAADAGKGGGE